MRRLRLFLMLAAPVLVSVVSQAYAQTVAAPTSVSTTAAELAKAKSRVLAAERNYRSARDRVLALREERNRLSRDVSEAERRKIKTTTSWSKRADDYATQDLRDYRADLNHVNREEARASTRLDEANQELTAAKKALAIAQQRDQAARGK